MTTGRHVTYWTLIADAAQRQPDRPLLADEHGRSLTARQLHDAACATAAAFAERGDLGLIDENGNVRVTGRIKDAIVRNAENVSALEVENALATHHAVADAAVIGIPDPRTGTRLGRSGANRRRCRVVGLPGAALPLARTQPLQAPRALGDRRYVAAQSIRKGDQEERDLRQAFG